MVSFLKNFLLEKDILVALEEGGTCMDIIEALRRHGNDKTFLQEAIDGIHGREIFHDFVDITKNEVEELIRMEKVTTVDELRKEKATLRDEYIAKAAIGIFRANERKNGLLLIADKHFNGVKRYFEQSRIQAIPDRIDRFEWYISNDKINLEHGMHS